MNSVWNEYIDSILSVGIDLRESNINNWALDKDQAIEVIKILENSNVPILGGDVCNAGNGILEFNYDNWYCDKIPNETYSEFTHRSAELARQYIINYCDNNSKILYFLIIPLVVDY